MAATRLAPVEGANQNVVALESVESFSGQLVAAPWIESDQSGNEYRAGDLLFGKLRPYLAKAWVADRDGSYIGDFIRMSPRVGFNADFLRYAMLTPAFISAAAAESTGSKMPRTEWERIRNLTVPAPTFDRQAQIVDYLDHETAEIDAFIVDQDLLRRLVDERESAARESAVLISGGPEIELRRVHPTRTTGTSVNGDPWPTTSETAGVLKTGAASKGYFDATENKEVTDPDEIERLSGPVVGDRVLVNRANTPALVGTAVYVDRASPNLYLSDKLWSIDFDASNEYMANALSTRKYREQVALLSVGASASMHNLSYEDFLRVRLPIPDKSVQVQIAEKLDRERTASRQTQNAVNQSIALAKERRAALISAAVTGQIDVSGRRRGSSEAERLESEVARTQ